MAYWTTVATNSSIRHPVSITHKYLSLSTARRRELGETKQGKTYWAAVACWTTARSLLDYSSLVIAPFDTYFRSNINLSTGNLTGKDLLDYSSLLIVPFDTYFRFNVNLLHVILPSPPFSVSTRSPTLKNLGVFVTVGIVTDWQHPP